MELQSTLGRQQMHRCDGCGRQFEEDELTELEFFQGVPMQNLCSECQSKIFVKKEKKKKKMQYT